MTHDEILKLAERAELVSLSITKSAGHNAVEKIIQKQCLHFAELLFEYAGKEAKTIKMSKHLNDLAYFKDLADKSRDNPQDRQACYVELLESNIETQNQVIETFVEELKLILVELTQEKS